MLGREITTSREKTHIGTGRRWQGWLAFVAQTGIEHWGCGGNFKAQHRFDRKANSVGKAEGRSDPYSGGTGSATTRIKRQFIRITGKCNYEQESAGSGCSEWAGMGEP